MFYLEEKRKYVSEELAREIAKRPHLTQRERRILRGYYEKEFEDVWANRDFINGYDDGESVRGQLGE